jgi:MoaA/NifB/PqqE/SkfB family radical SAM enzyme
MDKAALLASSTFCLMPWMHANVRGDGNVYSCCMADHTHAVDTLAPDGLAKAWNAPRLRELRLNMLEAIPSPQCQGCYDNEAAGGYSLRRFANSAFPHGFSMVPLTTAEGRLPGLVLRFFDVRWGVGQQFWDHLSPYLDEVEEALFFELTGDEGEHARVLHHWRARGMRGVRLRYRTAGVPIPRDLLALWQQFDDVEVTMQLDEQAFFFHSAAIEASLRDLRAHAPGVRLQVVAPFSALSAHGLTAFLRRWLDSGLIEVGDFKTEYVGAPAELDPQLLPDRQKAAIREECQELRREIIERYGWDTAGGLLHDLQELLNRMSAAAHPARRSAFLAHVRERGIDPGAPESPAWLAELARDDDVRPLLNGRTFCVHPWTNLNSTPDGRVKLCCNITREDGTVRRADGSDAEFVADGVAGVWNSEHMRSVRRRMLAGEHVSDCDVCYHQESWSEHSSRTITNHRMLDRDESHVAALVRATTADGELAALPTSLELRLGNQCNLRCNSCTEWSSNSVGAENAGMAAGLASGKFTAPAWLRAKLDFERARPRGDFGWHQSETFLRDAATLAPGLRRLYLTGGEPTMIRANQVLVDQLLEAGNLDCHFSFTTNLTLWNEGFYAKLARFKASEVQVSIDALGAANNYIRAGSDWAVQQRHFAKLLALPSHIHVVVYTVVQACNVHALEGLVRWLLESSQGRFLTWYPIPLEYPLTLQASLVPAGERIEAAERLRTLAAELTGDARLGFAPGLAEAAKFLGRDLPATTDGLFGFKLGEGRDHELLTAHLDLLDAARGTRWRVSFPELAACLPR